MDKALDSLYNLSSTAEEREAAWDRNKQYSQNILSEYELDQVEKTVVWAAGILAGAVDAFFVTDVRQLERTSRLGLANEGSVKHLKESGSVNQWMDSRIKNFYSSEEIHNLERNNWVPYDSSVDSDVLGLNPKTHRLQSFGHDPLLGFYYGVRDIMKGTFTVVDNNGTVMVKSMVEGGASLFEAIAIQFGHLQSDLCTSAGLPVPFMGQLLQMQGTSTINGMTYNRLFKNMYIKGYNFNHLLTMGIPALIIEVIVRISYLAYQLYKGKTFMESIPINKPKIDRMLFYSYLIATGCNGVKMVVSNGNIFAFNPVLWGMCLRYGISELKRWWTNEVEKKRHEYVMGIYEKHIKELDIEIEKGMKFY